MKWPSVAASQTYHSAYTTPAFYFKLACGKKNPAHFYNIKSGVPLRLVRWVAKTKVQTDL